MRLAKNHLSLALLILATVCIGCGRGPSDKHAGTGQPKSAEEKTIRVTGSDTMVNVAQAWAEEYMKKHPGVNIDIRGGGSGVGIASLIDGKCDMANSSRKMTEGEIKRTKAKQGAEPQELIVGYDALAIYVPKDNPLDSISIDELAEIYGQDGKITKWSDLGVKDPKFAEKEITRVSRQSSSGTYAYFREVVVGKTRDYKLGSIDQNGSKDVVAMVSRTPSAIGYSGMGYKTSEVKTLKVSKHRGGPAVEPTVKNARNGSYPITRPLQIYVVGEPTGIVKEYLDWIHSAAGQRVLLELGYVPLTERQ
ncbi:MAG: phosphate ABC transporter substrate-binding protein [Planctomycetaceae bacterium]|nr:phosphate ABC transporter substrate-binding protein [Planctomycetaceae bacterium]